MSDGPLADIRDTHKEVTQTESGKFIADTIRDLINYDAIINFPNTVTSKEEQLAWLSQGKQLSLAAGNGTGERGFANALGVKLTNVTFLDKGSPANLQELLDQGVTFVPGTMQHWAAENMYRKVNNPTAKGDQYRLITLFGAEYAFDSSKMVSIERQVFVSAVALALEPGGILCIAPEIPDLDTLFIAAGLVRIDWESFQMYQKPVETS